MSIQFWHMQMFPGEAAGFAEKVPYILQHYQFIGLGDWEEKKHQIPDFCERMKVNDVVAIKNGSRLVALVQVIGGVYEVSDDPSEVGWIVYRRPIRVLDWAIDEKFLPHPRGTLNICESEEAKTTEIIKDWYENVVRSFKLRGLPATV